MKVGDLAMRLVLIAEEWKWETVMIVDSDEGAGWPNLLIMSNAGQKWVDADDLTAVQDWEEMVG